MKSLNTLTVSILMAPLKLYFYGDIIFSATVDHDGIKSSSNGSQLLIECICFKIIAPEERPVNYF